MAQSNLKQKATSGMVWTAFQKYSKMVLQFVSGIILARLLTPYDYGCIGILGIFMALSETIIDGGFGSALIQKKRPTQGDYSTIFWWNLGMAVVMYAILFFCAPAISFFFNIPILCDIIRVQGVVLIIYAFNIIQQNQLKKNFNFKLLSIVSVTTTVVSLGITILMAYKGFGVWALVAQNMISALIPACVYWFYIKWRPIRIFSWQSIKELFGFGLYMFLTNLVDRLGQHFQGILIGRLYNPSIMGYYSKARGTEQLASTSISQVMSQVAFPMYAEVQDDKVAMQNIVKRLTMTLSYITFPLMFVLLLCAKPIFVLLYSDRWIQCVPYFQILCIAGLSECLQAANFQTIAAIGKSRTMFLWTLLKRTIGIGFVVVGLVLWGMRGLLIGLVFNSWFAYFVNISLVSKHIGYKWWRQLLDILPVAVVSVLAALVSYGCGYLFELNMYLDGILKLLVFAVLYLGWSFIFKPEVFNYFTAIIASFPFKRICR